MHLEKKILIRLYKMCTKLRKWLVVNTRMTLSRPIILTQSECHTNGIKQSQYF